MKAIEYIENRINTGDRFLVNLHKDDRALLATIMESYAKELRIGLVHLQADWLMLNTSVEVEKIVAFKELFR